MSPRAAMIALACIAVSAVAASAISSCAAAGPAVITAMAGGASVYNRAQGGCYAECAFGTRCNPNDGLCEKLDCRCGDGFRCAETETGTACVVDDRAAALAARPQEQASGAQPFGDGQQASKPLTGLGTPGGEGDGAAGRVDAIHPQHSGADGGVAGGASIDAGSAVPADALKTPSVKLMDPPPSTPASQPWLEGNNPWDPRHAEPAPQMANPNQPPPH